MGGWVGGRGQTSLGCCQGPRLESCKTGNSKMGKFQFQFQFWCTQKPQVEAKLKAKVKARVRAQIDINSLKTDYCLEMRFIRWGTKRKLLSSYFHFQKTSHLLALIACGLKLIIRFQEISRALLQLAANTWKTSVSRTLTINAKKWKSKFILQSVPKNYVADFCGNF